MIKVNFIPENLRKEKTGLFNEGLGLVPREVIIGILVAAIGFLVFLHTILALVAAYKVAQYTVHMAQWNAMAADKKILDNLTAETQTLQKKMNTLRPITSAQAVRWARFMNDISNSVPKGVWLREIRYDKGKLTIYGSAVSKIKNEMIITGNFVAALKETPTFKESFLGIDVDSIQGRNNTALSIADFSLKTKQKMTP